MKHTLVLVDLDGTLLDTLVEQSDDAYIDAALSDFKAYYTAHIDVYTHPYPGMQEVVNKLDKEGVRLAIASNKFQEGTEYRKGLKQEIDERIR